MARTSRFHVVFWLVAIPSFWAPGSSIRLGLAEEPKPAKRERPPSSRWELQKKFERVLGPLTETPWTVQKFHFPPTEKASDTFASAVDRAHSSVNSIFAFEGDLSAPFLTSMDVSYAAFQDVAETRQRDEPISRPLFHRIIGASYDLAAKAASLAHTKPGKALVTIAVHTVKPGTITEVNGLSVWYAPFFDDREVYWGQFNPKSSPAIDDLPPGIWSVWAVDSRGESGRRGRLTLRADREPKPMYVDAPQ